MNYKIVGGYLEELSNNNLGVEVYNKIKDVTSGIQYTLQFDNLSSVYSITQNSEAPGSIPQIIVETSNNIIGERLVLSNPNHLYYHTINENVHTFYAYNTSTSTTSILFNYTNPISDFDVIDNYIVVGEPAFHNGKGRIYLRNTTDNTYIHIEHPDESVCDFGHKVRITNDMNGVIRCFVSAPGTSEYTGAVYVIDIDILLTTFTFQQTLVDANHTADSLGYGTNLAYNAGYLMVSATNEKLDTVDVYKGKVYVYFTNDENALYVLSVIEHIDYSYIGKEIYIDSTDMITKILYTYEYDESVRLGFYLSLNGTSDLSGVDLSGVDLRNSLLSGLKTGPLASNPLDIHLPEGFFNKGKYIVGSGVELRDAELFGQDLRGVPLTNTITGPLKSNPSNDKLPYGFKNIQNYIIGPGIHLQNVDFTSADMLGIDWTTIDFEGLDLSGANLTGCTFSDKDLTKSNFTNAILRGVQFLNCKFKDVNCVNADFTGATCSGADFTGSNMTSSTFTSTDFRDATFKNTILKNTKIINSSHPPVKTRIFNF